MCCCEGLNASKWQAKSPIWAIVLGVFLCWRHPILVSTAAFTLVCQNYVRMLEIHFTARDTASALPVKARVMRVATTPVIIVLIDPKNVIL